MSAIFSFINNLNITNIKIDIKDCNLKKYLKNLRKLSISNFFLSSFDIVLYPAKRYFEFSLFIE